eukprot:CAMPEP_0170128744 /NCGR_PEP_ID=MMETSP0020_2-20130122/21374_1 /TAXON_ID=98059 /ORGANISM="Dinobryon sp., Strain UTEXLB2267" /LENGTH=247 /DNA_ID=CAMNT_0010362765 /DNA_START=19 /DNA_END=761 /DNA_ORIENTATION=+
MSSELELLEYKKEGIDFNVAFTNNQESLDLIGVHIFKILDDQCKLPNATDERFSSQLYKELSSKPKFSATKKEQRDAQFTILHFAGPVQYSSSRFIEKNIDELPADVNDDVAVASVDESFATNQFRKTKLSLSHQFKDQLNELMSKLNDTVPFYVRCIKPIDLHSGDNSTNQHLGQTSKAIAERNQQQRFNESRVSEQLHNGGVFVAIKVARSGYAVRLQFYDFYCDTDLLQMVTVIKTCLTFQKLK